MPYSGNLIALVFIFFVKTSCIGYGTFVKENLYKRTLIKSDETAPLEPKTLSTVILVRSLAECAVNTVDKSGSHFLFNKESLECIIETVDTLPGNVPKGYTRFDSNTNLNLTTKPTDHRSLSAANNKHLEQKNLTSTSEKPLLSCYYRPIYTRLVYIDAERTCHNEGGYIVRIDSEEEYNFMLALNIEGMVWLGKIKWLGEKSYVWENKRNSTYWPWKKNYKPEKLDQFPDMVCILSKISSKTRSLSGWELYRCGYLPYYSICEFDYCEKP